MLNRIVNKIKAFLFYKRNKLLKEVFGKLNSLRDINETSYKYSFAKTVESYFATLWYRKKYNLGDLKSLNHNSDKTLFILGSGPSINEITKEQWNTIKNNESWGFNLWHVHDFVPNVYVAQQAGDDTYLHSRIMETVMRRKQIEYKDVTFILRGTFFNNLQFHKYSFGNFLLNNFKKLIPLPEYVISSTCAIEPETYLDIFHKKGFFDKENLDYPIPKFGATIGLLLPLAIRLGYKKIVLCGIDMLNNNHFYDDVKYSGNDKDLMELSKKESANVNPNANRNKRAFTDFDYILTFKKFLNKNNGDLYLSSPNSILYPHLEIYPDFTK